MTKYAPYAPFGIENNAFLVSARVHNWVYAPYLYEPDWNALSIH